MGWQIRAFPCVGRPSICIVTVPLIVARGVGGQKAIAGSVIKQTRQQTSVLYDTAGNRCLILPGVVSRSMSAARTGRSI